MEEIIDKEMKPNTSHVHTSHVCWCMSCPAWALLSIVDW